QWCERNDARILDLPPAALRPAGGRRADGLCFSESGRLSHTGLQRSFPTRPRPIWLGRDRARVADPARSPFPELEKRSFSSGPSSMRAGSRGNPAGCEREFEAARAGPHRDHTAGAFTASYGFYGQAWKRLVERFWL